MRRHKKKPLLTLVFAGICPALSLYLSVFFYSSFLLRFFYFTSLARLSPKICFLFIFTFPYLISIHWFPQERTKRCSYVSCMRFVPSIPQSALNTEIDCETNTNWETTKKKEIYDFIIACWCHSKKKKWTCMQINGDKTF